MIKIFKFYFINMIECVILRIRWLKRSIFNIHFDKKRDYFSYSFCDIYYINLDHRLDRRIEIEEEFKKIDIFGAKRINAIKKENGALGCAMSHRFIYNLALSNNNLTWVCEDDISFLTTRYELENLVNEFFNDSRIDVLSISYNARYKVKVNRNFYITSNTQTMSCYIIKPHVLNDFINIANESILGLEKGGLEKNFAIDKVWKKLQRKYIFAISTNVKVIQRPSFSDIRKINVDYHL